MDKLEPTTTLSQGEFHQLAIAHMRTVHASQVLGEDDVLRALEERSGMLSGIANACLISSDNPRANTIAKKLLTETVLRCPHVDEDILRSVLSWAFSEASKLCAPSAPLLDGDTRRKIEVVFEETYPFIINCYHKKFGIVPD